MSLCQSPCLQLTGHMAAPVAVLFFKILPDHSEFFVHIHHYLDPLLSLHNPWIKSTVRHNDDHNCELLFSKWILYFMFIKFIILSPTLLFIIWLACVKKILAREMNENCNYENRPLALHGNSRGAIWERWWMWLSVGYLHKLWLIYNSSPSFSCSSSLKRPHLCIIKKGIFLGMWLFCKSANNDGEAF